MSSGFLPFLLTNLVSQIALLLVCLVGLILAAVFLRRNPLPSIVTLIAIGLLMLTAILTAVIQAYLFSARENASWTTEQYAQVTAGVGLVSGIFRALGIALLLVAVFSGRRRLSRAET